MNEPRALRNFTGPTRRQADYTVVVRLLSVEDGHRLVARLARGLREEVIHAPSGAAYVPRSPGEIR